MRHRLSLVSLLALALSACHVNPVTNQPQVVLTSRDTEKALGDEQAAKIEATVGLVDDPVLADYVAAIGARLVEQAPADGYDFRFQVVDMKEPNAFALPGGKVYVSRGLLMLANSEDEIAGVIGHEIAHVLGRDTGNRISLGAPLSIATGLGALATGIVSPALGNLVGGIGGATQGLLLSPHDRQQERRADAYGLELAGAAGWNPEALPALLQSLERYEDLEGNAAQQLSFFASHPRTPDRVRDTSREAATVQRAAVAPIADSAEAFLAKLDGLVVGDDPAGGVFDGPSFVQPDMRIAIRFPDGWETHNTGNQVVAVAPEGRALALLSVAGEGDDPMAAADAIGRQLGIDSGRFKSIDINGLRAVRTGVLSGRTSGRATALEATWIAHRGTVYQVVCVTSPDRVEEFHKAFKQTPHSFRAASAAALAGVRVTRLRIHRAEQGETVAALLKRVGSPWDAATAAVANAVDTGATFAAGQLVKAPIEESYTAP